MLVCALQYVWFHYQDKVRCSTFGNSGQKKWVGGHIASAANATTLEEHMTEVEKQWDIVASTVHTNTIPTHDCICMHALSGPLSLLAAPRIRAVLHDAGVLHWNSSKDSHRVKSLLVLLPSLCAIAHIILLVALCPTAPIILLAA